MAGASACCPRSRLPDSDVISLLIHAAQANAGITFRGSNTNCAWDNLDHTHVAQGLFAEFKEKLRSNAAQGLWDDFKVELANHVEGGTDAYELCKFPGLTVNGERVDTGFTHFDFEKLIDAQLRPHADDVDDETGEIIRNEYV
jgi:hypothetical protein